MGTMDRRHFLALAGAGTSLGLAGCTGDSGSTPADATATPSPSPTGTDRSLPDGVYVQRFRETMAMQGTTTAGPYGLALMYAVPHAFWQLSGAETRKTPRAGDVHLMAQVWDAETGTVLPEAGVTVQITKGDEQLVSQEVVYPMLSQRMGFHYGRNFELSGDGSYVAALDVGEPAGRTTGAFAGRFDGGAAADIEFAFTPEQRERITAEPIQEYGQRGALRPMEMGMVPQAYAPTEAALPGEVLATTTSDDATFVSTRLDEPPAGAGDGAGYLAVSARTPYTRIVLPAMALSATVERGGETVYDGPLRRTLDPELYYHYSAAVDVQSGDSVTLSVDTPPQTARHVGYERAFIQMDPMSFTA